MATAETVPPTTNVIFENTNLTTPVLPVMPSLKPPLFEVSQELTKNFSFYSDIIFSPMICVLGLFGNSVGFYIMVKDKCRKKMSIYLFMLALLVFDNIFLVLGMVLSSFHIVNTVFGDWETANRLFTYFSFVAGYTDFFTFHTSSMMLIIMSLERLRALVSPFTFKQSWISIYPYRIIFVITIVTGAILLPYPFCFKITVVPWRDNTTLHLLTMKPEFADFYRQYGLVEGIISLAHPIILLGINISLPIALFQFQKRRKASLKNASEDLHQWKITMMVFCVTTLYILLFIPKVLLQILVFTDDNYNFYGAYSLTFFFFTSLGDVLARLNAANDFLVYVFVSDHYRRLLRIMFCRRCMSDKEYNKWTEFQSSVKSPSTSVSVH